MDNPLEGQSHEPLEAINPIECNRTQKVAYRTRKECEEGQDIGVDKFLQFYTSLAL